jgi:hypothetical protein
MGIEMLDTSTEGIKTRALEEILRMARTPPNDRESTGSLVQRRDIEKICVKALFPEFYK